MYCQIVSGVAKSFDTIGVWRNRLSKFPQSNDQAENKPLPDTLRAEHLNLEETQPIRVAIGKLEDYGDEYKRMWEHFTSIENASKEVDFFGSMKGMDKKEFKNAGEGTYLISTVDSADKFTHMLINCTSLIVAGVDKETGENISLLTHQNPGEFIYVNSKQFVTDLRERLMELKNRSKDMTVDAVIVGGSCIEGDGSLDADRRDEYRDSMRLLSGEIKHVFGFDPVVVGGPKDKGGGDNVYYENKNRRAFLVRPDHIDTANQSFNAGDFEKAEKDNFGKKL